MQTPQKLETWIKIVSHNIPELGSGFLDVFQPTSGKSGHIYPDFNASMVVVVMVEVVVVLLGGVVCVCVCVCVSELTHESYKDTLISGLKYQFVIKLITISLAGIIRSSAEIELVYKFDCKLNHVTLGHYEWICLGPEFCHVLHWIYQYMLGCCIHMYFIVPHRLHAYNICFKLYMVTD